MTKHIHPYDFHHICIVSKRFKDITASIKMHDSAFFTWGKNVDIKTLANDVSPGKDLIILDFHKFKAEEAIRQLEVVHSQFPNNQIIIIAEPECEKSALKFSHTQYVSVANLRHDLAKAIRQLKKIPPKPTQ